MHSSEYGTNTGEKSNRIQINSFMLTQHTFRMHFPFTSIDRMEKSDSYSIQNFSFYVP